MLRNGVSEIIHTSSSDFGSGTFLRGKPSSILHLLGHWPVFVIVLNICAAGLASSGPNSFASFVGKSPGTPPLVAFAWDIFFFYHLS